MQPQRIELVGGVAASICGFSGLAAVLFAPLRWVLPDNRFPPIHLTGYSLAVGPYGLQLGWAFERYGIPLAISALLLVAIGVGAVTHSTRRVHFARMLLWSSTGGLLLAILVADVPGMDVYLLPSI